MSATSPVAIHPFQLRVDDLEVPTLLCASTTCGVSIADLKAWNRNNSLIAAAGVDDELPLGSIVQLPPLTYIRHPSYGSTFLVGEMLLEIQQVQTSLDRLWDSAKDSPAAPFVPRRRVTSMAAHFVDGVRRESASQLARIHSEYATIDPVHRYGKTWKELLVEEVIDPTPVVMSLQREQQAIVASGLVSLQPEHTACMSQHPVRSAPNVVTELKEHRTRDMSAAEGEELTCPFHSREVEVSFFQPGRAVAHKETWAVLACQTLASLVDAVECMNEYLPYPKTRNSFMFIAGTFYIDDRHEGYEDISSYIRNYNPFATTPSELCLIDGANPAYGVCPVKSITTRIADIPVKMHEMCVYRHMGSCDHYFYFKDLSLPIVVPKPRSQYPRRTYISRPHVTLCDMCAALPSTIITYGDIMAPKNPTFYCPPCFRIFHVDEVGEETNDGYLKVELPPGQHF